MFKSTIKRYLTNDSGHVAVITGIVGVPLLLVISLALDSHVTDGARVELQAALDNAAIAAVADQTLTNAQRTSHAESRFWANISDEHNTQFKAESNGNQVYVEATRDVDTMFAGVIGTDTIKINAKSAAEIVKGETVCMLALDPNSAGSFTVAHGATLEANCSVQVNSLDQRASMVTGGGQATAKGFCIGGGTFGEHKPFVNTECSTLDDPYRNTEILTPSEPCIDQTALNELTQDWRSTRDAVENHEIEENKRWEAALAAGETLYPTFFEKNHLKPGNYCEGLFLEANEFIVDPGVYHITGGALVFGLGTELIGEGVTFVLHGEASIEVRNGSILNLKSPISGPLEGLVFAQNLEDKSMLNPTYPNVESTFTSGSILNLLGTVYLPSHKIQFLGGSNAKTHAPATAFIAHQISIDDGADITIAVDHVSAGTSPIQPRSDRTVRLMQ